MNCGGRVMTIDCSCARQPNPIARREQEMFQYAFVLSSNLNPDSGQANCPDPRTSSVHGLIKQREPFGATHGRHHHGDRLSSANGQSPNG